MKKAVANTKKRKSGSKPGKDGDSPSHIIDARIKKLGDWRGETLARVRALIKQADTLLLTVPNQLGVDYNAHVIEAILKHVAPGMGWR